VLALCCATLAVVGGCSRCYHVTETYALQSGCRENEAFLALVVPRSGPYQEVTNLKVTWDGPVERETDGANEIVRLRGPVGPQAMAVVDYDLLLPSSKPLCGGEPCPADLAPASDIECDHPFMVHEARRLATGQTREDVYRIFEFVSRRIGAPPVDGGEKTAMQAYEACTGACRERAKLMVAILRAAGIPARLVDGMLIRAHAIPGASQTAMWEHPAQPHAWVEFYVDGRWESADPSSAVGSGSRGRFNAHGELISYGEACACQETFTRLETEVRDWALPRGKMLATRESPLRFIAAAKDPDCKIVPSVTMQKLWIAPSVAAATGE